MHFVPVTLQPTITIHEDEPNPPTSTADHTSGSPKVTTTADRASQLLSTTGTYTPHQLGPVTSANGDSSKDTELSTTEMAQSGQVTSSVNGKSGPKGNTPSDRGHSVSSSIFIPNELPEASENGDVNNINTVFLIGVIIGLFILILFLGKHNIIVFLSDSHFYRFVL